MPNSGSLLQLVAGLLNILDDGHEPMFRSLTSEAADEVVMHILQSGLVDTSTDIDPVRPDLRLLVRVMSDWDALANQVEMARDGDDSSFFQPPRLYNGGRRHSELDVQPHSTAIIWLVRKGIVM